LYSTSKILFTHWSYELIGVATGCSSPHCKECQIRHSTHIQLSCIMVCRVANVLRNVPVNCVTQV